MRATRGPTGRKTNLVGSIADRLRERVFEQAAGERIGALGEIATQFDVGIVTIQQAARVLEHEGLLEVRRGPGGGYYGRRPDARTLERALAAYMRMHPDSFDEALDMTSLLFIELCGAAARRTDPAYAAELEALSSRVAACAGRDAISGLETELQDLLFRMVDRPIFELLTRVTLTFGTMNASPNLYPGPQGVQAWSAGRRRIIAAIVSGDEALARFEADRSNRRLVLAALRGTDGGPAAELA